MKNKSAIIIKCKIYIIKFNVLDYNMGLFSNTLNFIL